MCIIQIMNCETLLNVRVTSKDRASLRPHLTGCPIKLNDFLRDENTSPEMVKKLLVLEAGKKHPRKHLVQRIIGRMQTKEREKLMEIIFGD